MSRVKQMLAVTAMGLRSVPSRVGTSLVVVIGVAAVVAVLVCALAVASSFSRAAAKTGSASRAIVLNGDTEADSGFSRENAPVVVSVMAEAVALGLVGAALGSGIAWLLLNGAAMSAMTGVTPSQLTFRLSVDPNEMLIGSGFAAVIVIIGGLLAAIRAARIPVAAALR